MSEDNMSKFTGLSSTITSLEKRIEELEAENKRLLDGRHFAYLRLQYWANRGAISQEAELDLSKALEGE